MGAIVKELKEKIIAAGGDTTSVQTVSEALDKLSTGGAGGIFMITLQLSADTAPNDSVVLISDKTVREIINASEAGMMVFASFKCEDPVMVPYPTIATFVLRSYTNTWMEILSVTDSSSFEAEYDNLDTYPVFN